MIRYKALHEYISIEFPYDFLSKEDYPSYMATLNSLDISQIIAANSVRW